MVQPIVYQTMMIRLPQFISGVSRLGWLIITSGVTLIGVIILTYWALDLTDNLLVGALGSTIAAVIAGIVLFLLARTGVSLDEALEQGGAARMMTVDPAHDDVEWGRIIDRSTNLDIVVAYYDNWADRYAGQLEALFARGGRVRIIMPDPSDTDLLNTLSATFFPDRTSDQIRERILKTAAILERLKAEAASPSARLEVLRLPRVPLYAMVVADDRRLYLSTFEQFREAGVQASVFDLRLSRSTQLGSYWLGRRDLFLRKTLETESSGEVAGK